MSLKELIIFGVVKVHSLFHNGQQMWPPSNCEKVKFLNRHKKNKYCIPLIVQGSHTEWKTWENGGTFSSQGKVREFCADWKSQGNLDKILEKSGKFREFLFFVLFLIELLNCLIELLTSYIFGLDGHERTILRWKGLTRP